jgi:menaquinone-dependent protoporphyrinogen oxidase
MQNKVLVAYATNAGSTAEVAEAIGKALGQEGTQVDVRRIKEVKDVRAYDAVIVGGPMIMGWHGRAKKFLKEHRQALSQVPVACFMTAMRLTASTAEKIGATPIYQDPRLAKPPNDPNKLSFQERFTTVTSYVEPVLKKTPEIKPVSVGLFAGKLDYGTLNIFHKLFVMLIIGATAGDYRNWEAMREWAASLRPALLGVQA